jgi:hypothetical protein
MRSLLADGEPSAVFGSRAWNSDFTDEPGIALLYVVTGSLMELLGPIFWVALVALLIQAELMPATDGWAF